MVKLFVKNGVNTSVAGSCTKNFWLLSLFLWSIFCLVYCIPEFSTEFFKEEWSLIVRFIILIEWGKFSYFIMMQRFSLVFYCSLRKYFKMYVNVFLPTTLRHESPKKWVFDLLICLILVLCFFDFHSVCILTLF